MVTTVFNLNKYMSFNIKLIPDLFDRICNKFLAYNFKFIIIMYSPMNAKNIIFTQFFVIVFYSMHRYFYNYAEDTSANVIRDTQ